MERFIEFKSSYPNDAIANGDDIEVPAGRNIMEAYRDWLKERGIGTETVEQHSSYGMSLDVEIDGGTVWQMIQESDQWLMTIVPDGLRIPFLNAAQMDARFDKAIHLFTDFLEADPKLDLIGSYTRQEFQSRGPDGP